MKTEFRRWTTSNYLYKVAASKKNLRRFLIIFISISIAVAASFIIYLGFLWWQSRQLHFVRYPEFGIPIPEEYQIHGIDVSRYQENISWEDVKEMQVENIKIGFAFIKATEGNANTDPFFKRNWRKARSAGIIRGAYHFFISTKDGKKQAENFIHRVSILPGDLPPVLDVEQAYGVPAAQIRKEVKTWLQVVEQYYNVKPVIYTNIDFYNKYLKGSFDEYPLWVAHYLQPHKPRITRDWTFWQHSEQGHVNGIIQKVDFNVFNGDSVSFKALLIP